MFKLFKRTFVFLSVLLFFNSCNVNNQSQTNEFRVAVLIPGGVEFFAIQKKGMLKAAEKFNLKLIFAEADWDAELQYRQVEKIIADKVDLIALCAVDSASLRSAVSLANKSNIPLITFTNVVGDSPEGLFPGVVGHVGRNEIKAGRMLATMLTDLKLPKDAKIILVQGAPGTAPQLQRRQGFDNVLYDHTAWSIVYDPPIENWSKENAFRAINRFIRSGKNVDVIACQWATGAVAAAMALRENGITDIPVVALEFSQEIIPYIQSREIVYTSYFSIENEGYSAIELANQILRGQVVEKFTEIIPVVVSSENVHEFKAEM